MAFFLQAPKSAGTVLLSAGSATQRLRWQPHQNYDSPTRPPMFLRGVCACRWWGGGASLGVVRFLLAAVRAQAGMRPALFPRRGALCSVRGMLCFRQWGYPQRDKPDGTLQCKVQCAWGRPGPDCNPAAMQKAGIFSHSSHGTG
jgi:hypothetical protein